MYNFDLLSKHILFGAVFCYANNIQIENSKIYNQIINYFKNSNIFKFDICKENFNKDEFAINLNYHSTYEPELYKTFYDVSILYCFEILFSSGIYIHSDYEYDNEDLTNLIKELFSDEELKNICDKYPEVFIVSDNEIYFIDIFKTNEIYERKELEHVAYLSLQYTIMEICESLNLDLIFMNSF
uniref:Uncharacterized protein n=1 Tax=Pithovirus LCDPAC02 TaxID=2506601 RepID=A0A481YP35_9VIRU|nr:MAG: hypothetical protein LCDPAC02_02300 [Pithovirus LCDPAC02]